MKKGMSLGWYQLEKGIGVTGSAINVFLKTSFDLSKIEVIVYTIITTGLGILIDRTLFNKYDE